jgi:3'(2'), 5'-bisphosphate nucleotidase
VAALACPNLPLAPGNTSRAGAIFSAVRGGGTQMVPLDSESKPVAVRVSAAQTTADARFTESVESGHTSHSQAADVAKSLGITREPIRMDSQAKYAVVGRGEAEIYLRLPTSADYREKIWDHAGGVLVVEEAGGRATDVDGKPLDFTRGSELSANRGVIVTNGKLHDAVLAALRQAGVGR